MAIGLIHILYRGLCKRLLYRYI